MDGSFKSDLTLALPDLQPALNRIRDVQTSDGAIPWFENGPWDPWNHVESAMALIVMGARVAAVAAFDYLDQTQREDGAWFGEYGNTLPMVDRDYLSRESAPSFLDSNFCAYPAVGVAHYLRATDDLDQVRTWWPMIQAALDFVLTLQRTDGSFSWSYEAMGTREDDALLAGNASIAKSLDCGIYLATRLGVPCDPWRAALHKLDTALRHHPDVFDVRGHGTRFAMDWYYPVLSGAFARVDAKARLVGDWDRFVIEGEGCRCVSDQPWVTMAESAELVLALLSVGERDQASRVFESLHKSTDMNGVYWMGWQLEEDIFWPKERPAWTQAAIILAADALFEYSGASNLLTERVSKSA
ncbi:MAG: prenyltransferase/squalene oxidase repeat-containing protein [Henriciella sp.]